MLSQAGPLTDFVTVSSFWAKLAAKLGKTSMIYLNWNLYHEVIRSQGHEVTKSSFHWFQSCYTLTEWQTTLLCIRTYRSALQTNIVFRKFYQNIINVKLFSSVYISVKVTFLIRVRVRLNDITQYQLAIRKIQNYYIICFYQLLLIQYC